MDENKYNDTGFIGAVWKRQTKNGKRYWSGSMRNPNDMTDNGEFDVVMFASDSQNHKAPDFVFKKFIKKQEVE